MYKGNYFSVIIHLFSYNSVCTLLNIKKAPLIWHFLRVFQPFIGEQFPFYCLHEIYRNRFNFVKIISLKNGNFDLALRKRLFCNAKPTLLPCKTAAFGTQNNRFCNTLITKKLDKRQSCEKYLHHYTLISPYIIMYIEAMV